LTDTKEGQNIEQLLEEIQSLRNQVSRLESAAYEQRQAETLLHILRINSPIGLFIVQDRKVVFANNEFEKLVGITDQELKDTFSLDHVHRADREMVRKSAIRMLKGEALPPYKYRVMHKGRKVRWVMEGVVSIQYQGKRATLGHAMDITDRIRAEEKMRRLYENEKKLRKELEDEVNKRIEFTHALVHELKTPLTPVLLSSELLVEQLHEEPLASMAKNILRGARRLNNRTNELLDLAKVEIGRLRLEPRMLDTHRLLSNLADDVAVMLNKKHQILESRIPEDLPAVYADAGRLAQIGLNLLVNASKFTPEGGTIVLSARVEGDSVLVEVSDTGPGIPRADMRDIFKPYHMNRNDPEGLGGLGLGLSLCKQLVELHGGKIWVRSQVGKGSTVSFSMPTRPAMQRIGP
jgi:PAS domain S-box-containing protein